MNALRLLIPLAWRNLWRNPRRTIVTLIVVAAGLYSILCFASLLEAWAQSSRDNTLNMMTGSGQIHTKGYLDDPTVFRRMPAPNHKLEAVLDSPAIRAWVERVRVPAIVQSEYKTLPLTFVGVLPGREEKISTIPHQVVDGHYLSNKSDSGIVLGQNLAKRLKTRVGKRVIIMAVSSDGTLAQRSYNVVGLFSGNIAAEDKYAFTGIKTAQRMLGIGDTLSEISFYIPNEKKLNSAIASLRSVATNLDIRSWTALSPFAAAMDSFMSTFVYIWLWIMFVLIAIGVVNTQLMAVFERLPEFGLMQAIGMRPRLILAEVSVESVFLIGLGVIIGLACSVITIAALHRGLNLSFLARGAEYFGSGHILYPRIAPLQFVEISCLLWLLGIVVALWPAYKATKSNPVEVISRAS